MVQWRRRGRGFAPRRPSSGALVRLGDGVDRLARGLDGGLGLRLARLWRNWSEVLGGFSDMARPLGHRRRTLIIGCEDAMAMQDLTYVQEEILERVHQFLGEECFDKVRFELIEERASLDEIRTPPLEVRRAHLPRPGHLGGVRKLLENNSAIGRSYRAYVAFMAGRSDTGREGEGGGR